VPSNSTWWRMQRKRVMSAKSKGPAAKAEEREQIVRLRVICILPPKPEEYGAEFGLQDNSTTQDWVIHPGKAQANGDIHFECECRVRRNARTGEPNFLGPFVQGEAAKRFIYLSWRPKGWRPGQPDSGATWVRRMKVHLSSITWAQNRESNQAGQCVGGESCGDGSRRWAKLRHRFT
jgi:Family of unknown function (DUF5990)